MPPVKPHAEAAATPNKLAKGPEERAEHEVDVITFLDTVKKDSKVLPFINQVAREPRGVSQI